MQNETSTLNIIIRPAIPQDIPQILDVTQKAFTKYASEARIPSSLSALSETAEKLEQDLLKKTILVAYIDDVLVGTIRFEILQNGVAYISRFAVRPDIHNCGVGKELIKSAIEAAKNLGVFTLCLHTASKLTSLVKFYYNFGFYIHSTLTDRGYIRGLFCHDITDNPDFDPEIVKHL